MKKIVLLALLLCLFAAPALSETVIVDVTDLTSKYTITDAGKDYVITGTNNACEGSIAFGNGEFNVTLKDVTYDDWGSEHNALDLSQGTTLNLTLEGSSRLVSYKSAIHVPGGARLIIGGDGTLVATGGNWHATIGSQRNGTCGDIVINSGTVLVDCGLSVAGIGVGSGDETQNGSLSIHGGVVRVFNTMTYSEVGIGIYDGKGDFTINITGGIVDVQMGTEDGVGIGIGEGIFSTEAQCPLNISGEDVHVRVQGRHALQMKMYSPEEEITIGEGILNRCDTDAAFSAAAPRAESTYFEAVSGAHLKWEKQENGKQNGRHVHDCAVRIEQAHTYKDGVCSVCGAVDFSQAVITWILQSEVYDGAPHEPTLTVSLAGKTLKQGTDYAVAYADNIQAGTATVTVKGIGDYDGTQKFSFVITQANGTASVSLADWTYGETAKEPVPVSPTNGTDNVSYTYEGEDSRGLSYGPSEEVPVNAGRYTVTAAFKATRNYREVTAEAEFSIAKAKPGVPAARTAVYGQTLSVVGLPEGWTWDQPDAPVGKAGTNGHLAHFAENANYQPAQNVTVDVVVGQSQTELTAVSDKSEYRHGEQVKITVTPQATGKASALSLRRFTQPQAGQVSIWYGDTLLAEPQTAADGESVLFTLDTVAEGFIPGSSYTLTAKYAASDNLAEQETTVTFAVIYAEDTPENSAEVSGDKNEEDWFCTDPTLTAPQGGKVSLTAGVDAAWSDTLTLPVEEGEHTYTYYVMDENGRIAEKTVTVKVDKSAPEVESIAIDAGATAAVITASAEDVHSGVLGYMLKQNSGKENLIITDHGGGSFTVEGMAPGKSYEMTLTVLDKAGHTTAVSFALNAAQLPQTGDDSGLGLWLALMGIAALGMAMLRKKEYQA